MKSIRVALWATTALMGNSFIVGHAVAQSTGTRAMEAPDVVVVTGEAGPATAGAAVAETVDKTRTTIDAETIDRQNPGQTILQTLNLAPGINFTNSDPYGNSGGNIRLRGFDGNRVGLAFDGIPLNDTGNYATYTNQQLDSELITRASVNQGTTDVDSPTAAAIGGIINYVSDQPEDEMGGEVRIGGGRFNYSRVYLRGDSGEFGPWGTTAYVTASKTRYSKFKGPGNLDKQQYNAKVFQPLGGGDFVSVAAHYNRNRNNFYNNFATVALLNAGGPFPENDRACAAPAAVNGTAQNENTGSTFVRADRTVGTGSCTNYYNLRINPSDTANIRINSRFTLADNLILTIDPSFQYVMANGGGFTTISERDDRLDQNAANNSAACLAGANLNGGVDLNGDNDSCDTAAIYTPSNTNTRRYGVLAALIWDVAEDQRIRFSYTNDYGRHRQTGEATDFNRLNNPPEVYGGKEGWGDEGLRVFGRDGSSYRSRDRFSLAILNQFSVDYSGSFFDDALTVMVGARAPQFKRELNQYCYTQNGTSTVLCTTAPVATTLANGNVQFAGNTNQFVLPYATEFTYKKILPNFQVGYDIGDSNFYASYSEQIAVPRTDNLYTVYRDPAATTSTQPNRYNDVEPELTKNSEVGYRYTTRDIVATIALYENTYSNRVVSTLDNDPTSPTFNTTIDRNIGKVKTKGAEGSIGWNVTDTISLFGSFTYTGAKLQENQLVTSYTCPTSGVTGCTPGERLGLFIPTRGKRVVETPEWMYTVRADWDATPELSFGVQAKYVDQRFTTDVNDEVVPEYTTVDLDARYDLGDLVGFADTFVQLNITNVFDELYAVNISSGTNALTIADINPTSAVTSRSGSPRTFGIGAPRTALVTVGAKF